MELDDGSELFSEFNKKKERNQQEDDEWFNNQSPPKRQINTSARGRSNSKSPQKKNRIKTPTNVVRMVTRKRDRNSSFLDGLNATLR